MTTYEYLEDTTNTDCLVIPILENNTIVDQIPSYCDGIKKTVDSLVATKDFEGKPLQQTVIYGAQNQHKRILLIGLGKEEDITTETWKNAVGTSIRIAQEKKSSTIAIHIPSHIIASFGDSNIAKETVIAAHTATYSFDTHKEADAQTTRVETIYLYKKNTTDEAEWQIGIDTGIQVAESVNLARHLGNTPPSEMTPASLAQEAQKLGETFPSLLVKVLEKSEIEKLGMGCLLGVSQGSVLEPKFIIMEYLQGNKEDKPIVFVGKGITFDSGGLSLKPDPYIRDMKFDMLGAATVLGIMRAAAALGLKQNIIGLVPTCENMPSGSSYRPDDILRAMNGKTVLIQNTDAEGRLILADALSYASKYTPKHVIDFATLTGACVVALGNERSGLFTKDDTMSSKLQEAAKQSGEKLWRLPLGKEYTEAVTCEVADVKNIGGVGGARYAGASTAAAFLEYFTDYPWTHIDLSCSSYGEKGKPWIRGGANGFGVQTIITYLQTLE